VITLLRRSDYQRTPWKNNLGFTDQIAIHPPGADLRRADFLWRLSTARIERGAPFSLFPLHDRVLVVLSGAGVRVSHTYEPGSAPDQVEVSLLEPYEFPGDVPTTCELIEGPIADLSVFYAKDRCHVQAESVAVGAGETMSWEAQGATNFIFVAEGELSVQAKTARKDESFRIEKNPEGETLEVKAGSEGARLVLIQIESMD